MENLQNMNGDNDSNSDTDLENGKGNDNEASIQFTNGSRTYQESNDNDEAQNLSNDGQELTISKKYNKDQSVVS